MTGMRARIRAILLERERKEAAVREAIERGCTGQRCLEFHCRKLFGRSISDLALREFSEQYTRIGAHHGVLWRC
jgi:hypothetical protein